LPRGNLLLIQDITKTKAVNKKKADQKKLAKIEKHYICNLVAVEKLRQRTYPSIMVDYEVIGNYTKRLHSR